MTILALADHDDLEWRGPAQPVDIVVGLGDLADSLLLTAAKAHGTTAIFAVKGNHDSAAPFTPPIKDAHLKTHSFGGLRLGGFGGSWRYKPRGHHLFEQDEVVATLGGFPAVDIFITHNSPRLVHERDADTHQGFDAFNDYIATQQPRLLCHGHQHLARESRRLNTTVIGVFGFRYLAV